MYNYDFGYVRIYLCMGMNLWEYFYLGHVGIFLHGYGKNLVVMYGCVENFDCGKILLGHWL